MMRYVMSHPVRVCGLKPCQRQLLFVGAQSHPVRVRGLKLSQVQVMLILQMVAPRAGAWIETLL